MSSTQHQLIEQCATRLRGIVEALDNIHDTSPQRWSTDLDDVHSSAESLLALINDQAPPSEDQLIAAGLSYPLAKEDAVKLWYSGFRSEVITVLEAWEAIGHDTGINPDKEELLESLRNMAAICNAHGNDMPAQSAIDQRQVIADAITGALAFGAQASQPPAEDHWLRPFYDIGRAEGQRTQDLAMLVRMLASSLKRHAPDSNLVARATNYLAAKGLAGTPLRDAPASVEQAGGDERVKCAVCVDSGKVYDISGEGPWKCYACTGSHEVIGYANGDELDNMLDDRTAVLSPVKTSFHTVPVYREARASLAHLSFGARVAAKHTAFDELLREVGPELDAQPSPAQAEQAEAERPEMSSERAAYFMRRFKSEEKLLGPNEQAAVDYVLSLIAQHERIVGALRAKLQAAEGRADTLEHRMMGMMTRHFAEAWRNRDAQKALDGYLSAGIAQLEQERDAALARVAELEKQEPAGAPMPDEIHQMAFEEGQPAEDGDGYIFSAEEFDLFVQRLLDSCAAPVAQAQPEETPGEILAAKLIETWVTKHGKPAPWSTAVEITALATNMPNDERDRLLALDDDVDAQAQHSVPEGFRELLEMLVVSDLRKIRYADAWRREVHDRASSILALLAAAPGKSVPQAWLDVQAERRRQVEAENWTPEHDDQHSDGQMAQAAGCYALHAGGIGTDWPGGIRNGSALFWPWDEEWWKPSTARRDMVKACALGLAEIERLDRVAASQGGPSDA
ncbi:hypothetical protein [Pseudomonas aeruginosa]|uniref:hypothetical protein n=1 Tax=Pseudomonas aeruginosa TaxID=287 RepID=UPI001CD336FB|nr:hypothetical protein [Pseudomonas aeruginosa]